MPAFFSDFGNIVLNSFVFVQKIDVAEVDSHINILTKCVLRLLSKEYSTELKI